MEIDSAAPAVARGEIDIAAGPEVVWDVLADIEGWPRWNASIASAELKGELAPGSTFRWKAGPGTITSTLRHVDPPRELGWTGTTFGIKAVHVYRLEQRGGDEGLPLLKAEAERRRGGGLD